MYWSRKRGIFLMNANQDKILLPNDVRKLLNVDNKEIVELCKKTSVNPKKNSKGQIYFSVDEVRKLKNAKSSVISEMTEKKSALSLISKPNSKVVVNNLLETLSNMSYIPNVSSRAPITTNKDVMCPGVNLVLSYNA